jgi:peptidoglycan-associated lipoprotein
MKTKITLFLITIVAFSSCSQYYLRKGNKSYSTMQYDNAITNYNKYLSKKSSDDAKIKLANSYRLNNDYENAEKWYSQIVLLNDIDPVNMFHYAKILMNNKKYKEAKKWFTNYLKSKTDDLLAKTLLSSCDACENFYEDTTLYSVELADIPEITTAFGQVKYGNQIVFSADKSSFLSARESGWTGRSYLDLYYTEKDNSGKWQQPTLLPGDINGVYNEGPATFNKAKNVVYFTKNNYVDKKKLLKSSKNENNLKIFRAELVNGKWTNLEELAFNSNEYSCGHPALSPDEKTLYFVSDMPGGFGGLDIYKVTFVGEVNSSQVAEKRNSGEEICSTVWSAPQNLGKAINTTGNEMFPYVHNDGTLFFSSDGLVGLGGLDVFSSTFDGTKWKAPENLKYPLNSSKDDFAYVLNEDNKTGYLSSNRNDLDKIYEIRKNDPTFILTGTVSVKGSNLPVKDATVELVNKETNEKEVIVTDDNGKYSLKLKPESLSKIQATKDGYFKSGSTEISTVGKKISETFRADFQLVEIVIEKPIVLENIYYDLAKWDIREDAAVELDKFVSLLNENPKISVELSSHTDSRADDHYNMVLSEKRAKAAVDYLISKGIDANRLKWKGYGETQLVNRCANGVGCNEEEHQQNRRTEFKVIKIEEFTSK